MFVIILVVVWVFCLLGLVWFFVVIIVSFVLFRLHCLTLLQLHRFVRLPPSSLKLFMQKYNISFSITFLFQPQVPQRD